MLTRSKLLFAALAAAATMLSLGANASARSFSIGAEKEFEVLFREFRAQSSSNTITCPITLLARFVERTIPKVVGTQIGVVKHVTPVNGAEPSPCTGGSMTVLVETLPWNINYQGFSGRLPVIERIRVSLIRVSFRVRTPSGVGCLIGTTAAEAAFGEILLGAGGRLEGLRVDETARIRLGGGFLCTVAGAATLSGTGTILDQPGTHSLFITLI